MRNSWEIGNVTIPNRLVTAPMAGISNAAFRTIAKEFGAGLLVCEMISDKGIHFRNQKTLEMLHIDDGEHPISMQIFGADHDTLTEAACFVQENTDADIIDINMGCPVNKVIKTGAGSRWLLDPDKLYHAVEAVVKAVTIPVTVKMRIGWDKDHILASENALAAEKGGAAALAMHGRTRAQLYSGTADWEILTDVKKQLTIPFIGNGDIRTPEDAKRMLDEVGADAVMIGRALLGNPWLLKRTQHYLETNELLPEPILEEKISVALIHLERLIALKGESIGVREFRQHAGHYLRGVAGAAKIKVGINQSSSADEVRAWLESSLSLACSEKYNSKSAK